MAQEFAQKQHSQQTRASEAESPQPAVDLRDEDLSQITDDILDEIDGVLEENAEQFVNSYVQKGGE